MDAYHLNKIVGLLISPALLGAVLLAAGFVAAALGRRKASCIVTGLSLGWFLFWASPATYRWLAGGLEREFPVLAVEDAPRADAIRVLGGSVGMNTNRYPYVEMWASADRVCHAARLWKAGKAPVVVVTGRAEIPMLVECGVPEDAIRVCGGRNTEEEARGGQVEGGRLKVEGVGVGDGQVEGGRLKVEGGSEVRGQRLEVRGGRRSRILLVTSAWHMRRAMLMFRRYAPEVEVIPAAADYEALVRCGWNRGFYWSDIIPDAEMLHLNSCMFKEIAGYWGYRLLGDRK